MNNLKNQLLLIGTIIVLICLHQNYNLAAVYITLITAVVSYFYITDIDSHAFSIIFISIPLAAILCIVDNIGVGIYFCCAVAGLLISQLIIDFIIGLFNLDISIIYVNFIETAHQKQLRYQTEIKYTAKRAKLFSRSRYQYNIFYWLN